MLGQSVSSPSTTNATWLDPRAFVYQHVPISVRSRRPLNASGFMQLVAGASLPASEIGIDLANARCREQLVTRSLRHLVHDTAGDTISPLMFELDYLLPKDRCSATWDCKEHRHLRDHGWVAIDDWGLDIDAMREQSQTLLASAPKKSFVSLANPSIPALRPLLENRTLAALLESYLGGPVRYEGHVLLHLSMRVNAHKYFSAMWHHDRCGRRMKVFVFLHDVTANGKPTEVADRTHQIWYYLQRGMGCSRFSTSYVTTRHTVVPMTGRAGGGFVFDTNALHRGNIESNATRTVLILEFDAHAKLNTLKAKGHDGPCPSVRNPNSTVIAMGEPGHVLFPTEVLESPLKHGNERNIGRQGLLWPQVER